MKKLIYLSIFLSQITINAQIKNIPAPFDSEYGVYYKDLYNVLNPFIGTYLYTNGNTTFKIELRKKEHSSLGGFHYEDLLIGAYRYVENGELRSDTFNELNNVVHENGTYYDLWASGFHKGDWPGCDDCSTDPNNIWISGVISVNEILFKKIIHNGQEALRVLVVGNGVRYIPAGTPIPPVEPKKYPCCSEFIMIKQ